MAPPRKQAETEKTNILLQSWKAPVYSKILTDGYKAIEDLSQDKDLYEDVHEECA